MELGIWLPMYGGWLRSLDQPTGPDIASCLAIAQQSEALGFDFLYASENLLNCIHGPGEAVAEAWSLLTAIAATTSKVGLVGAIKPGFRSPFLVARMVDTLRQIAGRPVAINIVCGWWREEFDLSGVPWLDHTGRYERAESFLRSLHRVYQPPRPAANQVSDGTATSARLHAPVNYGLDADALPQIWISGHSEDALRMSGEWANCLFLNGMTDAALKRHVAAARQSAMRWGREVSVGINAYVIATETRAQAEARYREVITQRNTESIEYFRDVMLNSGSVAWEGLSDEQLVDSNAGFEARLIGSFEDVRNRLRELRGIGVEKVVFQFDDPMRDAGPFMKNVIRPLREEFAAEAADELEHDAAPVGAGRSQPARAY
ncbi:Methanesulfonate monooxygenase [Methyloligella halotolerans]|uniref:Methanesulfonate monooxygenase n=2 Tax=Methyloligella halotolerans TaxID=1177755 RepID=A0A1E2S3I0_9HYPH|nr:Methanesulfonate monooxygenase [Methyloligella halotolerans]